MSGLADTVLSHLGDNEINAIASQLGTDPATARNAVEQAIPMIVGGMAQSASTPDGAGALHSALQDHAGSSVGDVLGSVLGGAAAGGGGGLGGLLGGLLGGGQQGGGLGAVLGSVLGGGAQQGGVSGTGGAILGHVFGGNTDAANQGLGQATGLGTQNAGQLLAILAPIVMSVLAGRVQQQGLSPGGLGGMLAEQGAAGSLLNSILGGRA
jgi:hypothetical protein